MKTANQIADNYNRKHKLTKLVYEGGTWCMYHSGVKTRQWYTEDDLVEYGTKMGWGK